jgi:hypothetical protein
MQEPAVPAAATDLSPLILAGVIAASVLILIVAWIWFKTRRLPGEHVFKASRFSRGNRIFPAQLVITPESLTLFKPQWIGKLEESIHVAHVSSIKIDTNVLFADIYVETTGGHKPVVCYGHTKGDAVQIKKLLEGFQSTYYKSKA